VFNLSEPIAPEVIWLTIGVLLLLVAAGVGLVLYFKSKMK